MDGRHWTRDSHARILLPQAPGPLQPPAPRAPGSLDRGPPCPGADQRRAHPLPVPRSAPFLAALSKGGLRGLPALGGHSQSPWFTSSLGHGGKHGSLTRALASSAHLRSKATGSQHRGGSRFIFVPSVEGLRTRLSPKASGKLRDPHGATGCRRDLVFDILEQPPRPTKSQIETLQPPWSTWLCSHKTFFIKAATATTTGRVSHSASGLQSDDPFARWGLGKKTCGLKIIIRERLSGS